MPGVDGFASKVDRVAGGLPVQQQYAVDVVRYNSLAPISSLVGLDPLADFILEQVGSGVESNFLESDAHGGSVDEFEAALHFSNCWEASGASWDILVSGSSSVQAAMCPGGVVGFASSQDMAVRFDLGEDLSYSEVLGPRPKVYSLQFAIDRLLLARDLGRGDRPGSRLRERFWESDGRDSWAQLSRDPFAGYGCLAVVSLEEGYGCRSSVVEMSETNPGWSYRGRWMDFGLKGDSYLPLRVFEVKVRESGHATVEVVRYKDFGDFDLEDLRVVYVEDVDDYPQSMGPLIAHGGLPGWLLSMADVSLGDDSSAVDRGSFWSLRFDSVLGGIAISLLFLGERVFFLFFYGSVREGSRCN